MASRRANRRGVCKFDMLVECWCGGMEWVAVLEQQSVTILSGGVVESAFGFLTSAFYHRQTALPVIKKYTREGRRLQIFLAACFVPPLSTLATSFRSLITTIPSELSISPRTTIL
jgi:hypothetical protein